MKQRKKYVPYLYYRRKFEGTGVEFESIADLRRYSNDVNVSPCQLIKNYIGKIQIQQPVVSDPGDMVLELEDKVIL